MRLLASWFLVVVMLATTASYAQSPSEPPAPSEPNGQGEPDTVEAAYQRHMKNGIKLFKERKWDGAVAEFWAAYKEKPLGSPLINLALAYKQLKSSAKAIEVLELALEKHRTTLPADQVAAAEKEIAELKALLAWVTVKVEPDDKAVELYIDDRAQEPGSWSDPIPLEPGNRRFLARRRGYDDAKAQVQIVAGSKNPPVVLKLVQKDGRVRVQAKNPDAEIHVDGQLEARGSYDSLLPRGVHRVAVKHGDDEHEIQILVRPGGSHVVTQDDDGELASPDEVEGDDDDDFGPPAVLEPLRGVYGYGGGTLLTTFFSAGAGDETFEPHDGTERFGAAASLHLGYRVAEWAGFEFWGQYSDIRVAGTLRARQPGDDGGGIASFDDSQMILKSGRFGLLFRGWLPGRSWIRFTGTLGSGILVEQLSWRFGRSTGPLDAEPARGIFTNSDVEVGVFGSIDLGVEVEWSNVLFALMFQHTLQGTKHFDNERGDNVFSERPMLVHGASIRVGYGLW